MRSNETYSSTPKTCSQRGQGRPAIGCGSWSRAARGHARLAVGCGSHSHATHGHMRLVGRGSWGRARLTVTCSRVRLNVTCGSGHARPAVRCVSQSGEFNGRGWFTVGQAQLAITHGPHRRSRPPSTAAAHRPPWLTDARLATGRISNLDCPPSTVAHEPAVMRAAQ